MKEAEKELVIWYLPRSSLLLLSLSLSLSRPPLSSLESRSRPPVIVTKRGGQSREEREMSFILEFSFVMTAISGEIPYYLSNSPTIASHWCLSTSILISCSKSSKYLELTSSATSPSTGILPIMAELAATTSGALSSLEVITSS